jgi:hypothetical protein
MGANGISTTYPNQMLMAYVSPTSSSYVVPYAYTFAGTSSTYASISGNLINFTSPKLITNANNQGAMLENPTFLQNSAQGNLAFGLFSVSKIADNLILNDAIYNTAGVARTVSNNYSIIVEG